MMAYNVRLRAFVLLAITLVVSATPASCQNSGSGVAEISLVFPLNNATYKPTRVFPIVFAVQNPQIIGSTWADFDGVFENPDTNKSENFWSGLYHKDLSAESDTYLSWQNFPRGDVDGRWRFRYYITWYNCSSNGSTVSHNSFGSAIDFTISKDHGQDVDLAKAVTDQQGCLAATSNITDGGGHVTSISSDSHSIRHDFKLNQRSIALDIAGTIKPTLLGEWTWPPFTEGGPKDQACAVLNPGKSTLGLPTPDPCGLKISAEAAANVTAEITRRFCRVSSKKEGLDCPEKSDALSRAIKGGMGLCFYMAMGVGNVMLFM